jgi:hypothetical protein
VSLFLAKLPRFVSDLFICFPCIGFHSSALQEDESE